MGWSLKFGGSAKASSPRPWGSFLETREKHRVLVNVRLSLMLTTSLGFFLGR